MEKDKLNVRVASQNITTMSYENSHNLRTGKNATNQINNNENYLFYKGESLKFSNQDKKVLSINKEIKKTLKKEEARHIDLYGKNHKWNLKEKTRRSFIGGVLTFPKKIEDIDIGKVWKLGIKAIEKIAEHLDTELHYIALHTDEEGLIHFHYSLNNFNNTNGKSLNIERSKKGAELQDIAGEVFQEVKIYRGEKNTGRIHLTTEQYKQAQDTIDAEAEEIEKEVEGLTLEQLEAYKKEFKGDKLLKRIVDYAYRLKSLEEKEKIYGEKVDEFNEEIDNLNKKEKYINYINNTLDKVLQDGTVSEEEANMLYELFNSKALKGKLNEEAKQVILNNKTR